jgi:hypothetical protein
MGTREPEGIGAKAEAEAEADAGTGYTTRGRVAPARHPPLAVPGGPAEDERADAGPAPDSSGRGAGVGGRVSGRAGCRRGSGHTAQAADDGRLGQDQGALPHTLTSFIITITIKAG